jgi:hypothetical protein
MGITARREGGFSLSYIDRIPLKECEQFRNRLIEKIGWEAWTQSKSKSQIPQKMVKANTNAVNRATCGKPKTQQHWEIRNIKNRPMLG